MTERAVLAVSFGTSHRDTLEKNIAAIEAELAAAFPERTVRRAFTSGMILRKLAGEGTHIDNVPQALERLLAEAPASPYVLERELNSTPTSLAPGKRRKLPQLFPSKTSSLYALS